jgi:hypothetical protein
MNFLSSGKSAKLPGVALSQATLQVGERRDLKQRY